MPTIAEAVADLAAGRVTARALTEACLERIADPAGEGARAFVRVDADAARAMADASDLVRRAGRAASPLAGIPISAKDLFDVAGEPTPAGSAVLADATPAACHAPAIARVLAAGMVLVGRTNMTEFAFSGLGLNPHHGTPRSPWRRDEGHIPGGSSSGAAVSVADGMALAALGTDTGGSCRIPAAFCGIVGYKPTARRVPREGVLPLSPSLDSVGPLARTVACCAALDAILAGDALPTGGAMPVAGLRLAVPQGRWLDDMDRDVAAAFERALARLSAAGAHIVQHHFAALEAIPPARPRGTIAGAEAFAWHRRLLQTAGSGYDPRVRGRIEGHATMSAADYIDLMDARAEAIARMDVATAPFDALMLPTCPIVPPLLAPLEVASAAGDAAYGQANMLVLRNPTWANFLDRCAISLPCQRPGEAPVGLMLVGETMGDRRLFAIAAGIEAALLGG